MRSHYLVPADVLGVVTQLLNQMPALQSRGALNAIEALVNQQNQAPLPTPPTPSPAPAGGGGPGEEPTK